MVRLLSCLATAGVVAASVVVPARASDPGHGRSVFQSQCSACHSNGRSGGVVVGPPLFGVIGRQAGSVPGFSYSQTMKSAGFTWNGDRLRGYLPAPRKYLPGVKMTYPGLKNPSQMEDLIAYLETLK